VNGAADIAAVGSGSGRRRPFSGKRWENQIYPILKNVVLLSD
jgi:hypothetical protein